MIIKKCKTQIVCDVNGCNNQAEFFIKKEEDSIDYYSLKLCKNCAMEIKNLITKEVRKKEQGNESKAEN